MAKKEVTSLVEGDGAMVEDGDVVYYGRIKQLRNGSAILRLWGVADFSKKKKKGRASFDVDVAGSMMIVAISELKGLP